MKEKSTIVNVCMVVSAIVNGPSLRKSGGMLILLTVLGSNNGFGEYTSSAESVSSGVSPPWSPAIVIPWSPKTKTIVSLGTDLKTSL